MIDQDIIDLLQTIRPKPQSIRDAILGFLEDLHRQVDVEVPIHISKYEPCLFSPTCKHSFLSFMCTEHVGFFDELEITHLWSYRHFLDEGMKPIEAAPYIIAVRQFLRWSWEHEYISSQIAEDLYFVKDNYQEMRRKYISDMDPLALDIIDLL